MIKMYSIDRFEGWKIILIGDDNSEKIINRWELPVDAKETACVKEVNGIFYLDLEETEWRKKKILELQDRLFKKRE